MRLSITPRSFPHRGKRSNAIAIFARQPIPGRTKTRLITLLGRGGAADFQTALIQDATRKVATLTARSGHVALYLFLSVAHLQPKSQTLKVCARPTIKVGADVIILPQQGGGLGERLDLAFRALLIQHSSAVIIGTDSPLLAPRTLRVAFGELGTCDVVLGPCPDGGYYLVGLRADCFPAALGRRGIFARVRWGTAFAFRDTLRNVLERDLSCSILTPVGDVDRPQDLLRLRRELARHAWARRLAPSTWKFVKARVKPAPHG